MAFTKLRSGKYYSVIHLNIAMIQYIVQNLYIYSAIYFVVCTKNLCIFLKVHAMTVHISKIMT